MNRYDLLMQRVARAEPILLDGATGTEIEHRGVPQLDGAWNGGGALSHPDIVRQVHADYIDIGTDVVIANTFATHRSALKKAGVDADFDAYNRRGVELAIEARNRPAGTTWSSPAGCHIGVGSATGPASTSSVSRPPIRRASWPRPAPTSCSSR